MKMKTSYWVTGQTASLIIALAVSLKHDWTIGCAIGFIIAVLVDIRELLGKIR